jgi:hypothetical protein
VDGGVERSINDALRLEIDADIDQRKKAFLLVFLGFTIKFHTEMLKAERPAR